jgi:CRISPR system Cascade subunit CasD
MKYCVFQLFAPLVSWGDIAIGIERRSFSHPTKTAIVGLIAAAIGIKREEEEKNKLLADLIGVGIKLIHQGVMIRDFHTAQIPASDKKVRYYSRKDEMTVNPDKIETVLSRREYCCDSLAIVAIWLKNEHSGFTIDQIKTQIAVPYYHIYCGRKSCPPALPLCPTIIDDKNLKSALDKYPIPQLFPLSAMTERQKEYYMKLDTYFMKDSPIIYYWDKDTGTDSEYTFKTVRYDHLLSRKRWQFGPREEFVQIIDPEATDVYK